MQKLHLLFPAFIGYFNALLTLSTRQETKRENKIHHLPLPVKCISFHEWSAWFFVPFACEFCSQLPDSDAHCHVCMIFRNQFKKNRPRHITTNTAINHDNWCSNFGCFAVPKSLQNKASKKLTQPCFHPRTFCVFGVMSTDASAKHVDFGWTKTRTCCENKIRQCRSRTSTRQFQTCQHKIGKNRSSRHHAKTNNTTNTDTN